jgi:hypothetical protein
MSIEDELTNEVMAILKVEDPKVAVMVSVKVLVKSLQMAVDNGQGDAAKAMLQQAMDIADHMQGGRTQ